MTISLEYKDKDVLHEVCDSQAAVDALYAESVEGSGGIYDSYNTRYVDELG